MMNEKTIFKKVQRESYTIVSNQAVHDSSLSWKGTGLLTYLLSLPQDWCINSQDLVNRKTDGLASLRSGIEELKDHGYLRRFKQRDPEGLFVAHIIQVREDLDVEWPDAPYCENHTPYCENHTPYCENPQVDNPQMGNPQVENHTLLSTNITKETSIPITHTAQGAEISTEISALDWDNSDTSRAAVSKSLAVRFYAWCNKNNRKRPAAKHKAFVNLIDDFLERGYNSDEVWELLEAHHDGGFPWTLNSVAVTESRIRREKEVRNDFPDDWTDQDKEAYALAARFRDGEMTEDEYEAAKAAIYGK